jgi:DNA (cytosine-5)-methyltransferase 1
MKRQLRLGMNRGKPRLWLEGKILSDHGFKRHEPFVLEVTPKAITIVAGITTDRAKQRHVSGKTKGGEDHPIIDVNGAGLDAFADQDLLLVATPGSIVIRRAK